LAEGYVQANLVILPKSYAFEFLVFCQRNPKPCPILEVTDVGDPVVKYLADDADLRTDLPRYRVFKNGECIDEPENISDYWNKDLVGFLLGCSASFEYAIINANIRLRHIELGKIPPVYVTNIPCNPSNIFSGPMVVSMRAVPGPLVAKAVQVTSRYPATHGGPVFIGDSTRIGIQDLTKPAYGEWLDIEEDEVPMFWGCGITPQAVALEAKPEFMITHFAGNMFISDRLSEELAV
jgi:uncharacterized protein YcsI (UPF0317 family)